MFSFFKKRVNRINYNDEGSHERHWYALFGKEINESEFEIIYTELFKNPKGANIQNRALIITNDMVRGVMKDHKVVTLFPYLKGNTYQQLEISLIDEWSHVDGLEAIICAGHACDAAINFFAVDYMISKDIYLNTKHIDVKLMAFAYSIKEADMSNFKFSGVENEGYTFSEDFCGYMPGEVSDEINFVGKISKVRQHALNWIDGFIITVGITPEICIDIFVRERGIDFELVEDKHISGYAWITGTLEK